MHDILNVGSFEQVIVHKVSAIRFCHLHINNTWYSRKKDNGTIKFLCMER